MVRRCEHLRFTFESRQPVGIVGHVGRKHLNRDVTLQARIARAVHLAHVADAECSDNLVGSDACWSLCGFRLGAKQMLQ